MYTREESDARNIEGGLFYCVASKPCHEEDAPRSKGARIDRRVFLHDIQYKGGSTDSKIGGVNRACGDGTPPNGDIFRDSGSGGGRGSRYVLWFFTIV